MAFRQRLIRWHKCLVSIGAEASSKDSCREIELLAKEAALAVGRLMDDLEHHTERAAAMEGSGEVGQPQHELRRPGSDSSIALSALDQLSVAVLITESDGRVIEMNLATERIFQLGDGLLIRNGRLCARRAFEVGKTRDAYRRGGRGGESRGSARTHDRGTGHGPARLSRHRGVARHAAGRSWPAAGGGPRGRPRRAPSLGAGFGRILRPVAGGESACGGHDDGGEAQ